MNTPFYIAIGLASRQGRPAAERPPTWPASGLAADKVCVPAARQASFVAMPAESENVSRHVEYFNEVAA